MTEPRAELRRMTADPDARLVADVLAASDQPMTTELLLSAAKAYAALRSARARAGSVHTTRHRGDDDMINESNRPTLTSTGRIVWQWTKGPADEMRGADRWREIWLRLRYAHNIPWALVLTLVAQWRRVALSGWSVQDGSRLWAERADSRTEPTRED